VNVASSQTKSDADIALEYLYAFLAPAGIVNLTGASRNLARSGSSSGRHARALPSVERYSSKLFVHVSIEEMALMVE